ARTWSSASRARWLSGIRIPATTAGMIRLQKKENPAGPPRQDVPTPSAGTFGKSAGGRGQASRKGEPAPETQAHRLGHVPLRFIWPRPPVGRVRLGDAPDPTTGLELRGGTGRGPGWG